MAAPDAEFERFLDTAESLGLAVRTSSGLACPTNLLDSKGDMADSIMQLAVQHRFQVRQRHSGSTLSYLCKSFPECPFFVRGKLTKSGQVKLTKSNFTHNHALGVQKLPKNARNSMLCTKTLAQSVLAADIDYVNATASQLQDHLRTAFATEVSTSRVYSLKKALESGVLGNDVHRFPKLPKFTPVKRPLEGEDMADVDDDDDDDYRPLPTDVEREKDELKRQDREHRWEMDSRRMRMQEITNMRLDDEAKVTRRVLELEASVAEVQAKLAHAKARHALVQAGISADEVLLLL
ncbi:hypothetical protein DYB25_004669 [Aphanomyces astaci]|uniref:Uncharacterized protein n=1 Tax=Aphanomyces astaci TaxID=112090 RepID=A0A397B3D2_APHAT|nr:hypothetical protein DYB25_004669 [Aphanomyces astaci]RHY14667.1 hypothetical protein DYB36_011078 [Aphanomyces astaci]RHY49383.1 hypothetical protein DYB30_011125 [Aphanomyces astaci]RHZ17790.1 hypothetical protein DYB31_004826 [Aphanomyces astaci]RHZ40621.1 hypothetical protein DYB26_012239 [Aphanomyces astaci]